MLDFSEEAVGDDAIDRQIDQLASALPDYHESDGAAARGDKVAVTLSVWEGGEILNGLEDCDLTMTLGDGFWFEGLVCGIVGMKAGETKEFDFDLNARVAPGESYDKDNPVKSDAHAKVTVRAIKSPHRKSIDDAWVARNVAGCDTLAAFRARLRGQFEQRARSDYEQRARAACQQELARRLRGPVPDEAVRRANDGLLSQLDAQLEAQGTTRADYAREQGVSEDVVRASIASQAVETARCGIALEHLARRFGIVVSDANLVRAFPGESSKDARLKVKAYFSQGGSRADLERIAACEMALDRVVAEAESARDARREEAIA
jgi:trigger factor